MYNTALLVGTLKKVDKKENIKVVIEDEKGIRYILPINEICEHEPNLVGMLDKAIGTTVSLKGELVPTTEEGKLEIKVSHVLFGN